MTIAICPRCHDEISVPSGGRPESRVQCPLCSEEMRLEEVLRGVPPALIFLDPEDQHPAATAYGHAPAHEDGGYGGEEMAFAPAEPRPDFMSGSVGGAVGTVGAPTATIAASPPRARKQHNVVLEMIKIVGGGIAGIVLAVLLLWWIPKYGRDPFNLGPKVMQYAPWAQVLVPERFRGPDASANKKDSTGAGNQTNPKTIAGDTKPQGKLQVDKRFDDALAGKNNNDNKPPANKKNNDKKSPLNPGLDDGGSPAINDPLAEVDPAPPTTNGGKNPLDVVDPLATPDPEKTPTPPDNEPPPVATAKAESLATDLGAALAALDAFQNADATDKQARQRLGAELFGATAVLGDTAAKVDPRDSAVEGVLPKVKEFAAGIADTAGKVSMLSFLAAQRLDTFTPEGDPGIACPGKVVDLKAAGDYFEMQIEMSVRNAPRGLTIVTRDNPQDVVQVGDALLVLGRITDAKTLKGYRGEAAQVIVAGVLQKL